MRITKMWHRDTNWANAVGKIIPTDLLHTGLPQTFNQNKQTNKKAVSIKHNKAKTHIQKYGMPILEVSLV